MLVLIIAMQQSDRDGPSLGPFGTQHVFPSDVTDRDA